MAQDSVPPAVAGTADLAKERPHRYPAGGQQGGRLGGRRQGGAARAPGRGAGARTYQVGKVTIIISRIVTNRLPWITGEVSVARHGTPLCGPHGPVLSSASFKMDQASQDDHLGSCTNPLDRWFHPRPVMLPHPAQLEPGVDFLLTVHLRQGETRQEMGGGGEEVRDVGEVKEVIEVGQVDHMWGYPGPPVNKDQDTEGLQGPFRWSQVHRPDLASSFISGQFPMVYYSL